MSSDYMQLSVDTSILGDKALITIAKYILVYGHPNHGSACCRVDGWKLEINPHKDGHNLLIRKGSGPPRNWRFGPSGLVYEGSAKQLVNAMVAAEEVVTILTKKFGVKV